MEYPKNHFLVQLNALSTLVRHLDVHTLIYFETTFQALFPLFDMLRAIFCLRNVFS